MTAKLSVCAGWRGMITKIAPIAMCASLFASYPALSEDREMGTTTSQNGKVRFQVISLKRTEGETVTLRFKITNNGNDAYNLTASLTSLVDLIGRRTYRPGVASTSCNVPAGQQLICYAVFAAPPTGTQKMNVQFYEQVDLVTGIPISEQ